MSRVIKEVVGSVYAPHTKMQRRTLRYALEVLALMYMYMIGGYNSFRDPPPRLASQRLVHDGCMDDYPATTHTLKPLVTRQA